MFKHVAEDDVYMTWSWDLGICATNGNVSHAAIPFTARGWYVAANTQGQAATHYPASYCDSWNGYGQSSFVNSVFCPAITGDPSAWTFISFYNEIDGESYGGTYYHFTYSATGGCVTLLFFNHDSNLNSGAP